MADNTLIQMAKFDFTAPVKTVMLFEDDSDEEICPPPKKQKPNEPTSKEKIPEVEPVADTNTDSDLNELHKIVNNCILSYFALDGANALKSTSNNSGEKIDTRNEGNVQNNCMEQQPSQDKSTKAAITTEDAAIESPTEQMYTIVSLNNNTESNTLKSFFIKLKDNKSKSNKSARKKERKKKDKDENNRNDQQPSLDKPLKAATVTENATVETPTEQTYEIVRPNNNIDSNTLKSLYIKLKNTKSKSNKSARKKDRRKKNKDENNRMEQQSSQDKSLNAATDTENVITEPPSEQIHTIASPNNNTELNTLRSYFEKLKYGVSVYLAMIVRAYHRYLSAVKSGEKYVIEHSRKHFIHIKQYLYRLSYTAVDTIFIPQESDEAFARSFIESTIKVASKLSVKSSYEEIAPLYTELMAWAKLENRSLQTYVFSHEAAQGQQAKIVPMQRMEKNPHNNPQLVEKLPTNSMINGQAEIQRPTDMVCNRAGPPNVVVMAGHPPKLPSYHESINLLKNINDNQSKDNPDTSQEANAV